jgi:hypothetical protein
MNIFHDFATVCASVATPKDTTCPVLGHLMLARICASIFPTIENILLQERFHRSVWRWGALQVVATGVKKDGRSGVMLGSSKLTVGPQRHS